MTQMLGWADPVNLVVHTTQGVDQYDQALRTLGIEPGRQNTAALLEVDSVSGGIKKRLRTLDKELLGRSLLTLCTHDHELEHIRQSACTTTGLRAALSRVRQLSAAGSGLHSLFRRRPSLCLNIPIHKSVALDDALDQLVVQIQDFERGLACEFGYSVVPIEQVLSSFPKGLYSSRLRGDLPSSPHGLTVTHLLEGASRYEEIRGLQFWQTMGADPDVVSALIRKLLSEVGYHESWDYFVRATASIDSQITDHFLLWRSLLAIALWPTIVGGASGSLWWEDQQPCWRYVQAIGFVVLRGVPAKIDSTFIEEICAGIGVPSPYKLAAVHLAAYDGKDLPHPLERDFMHRHLAYCRDLRDRRPLLDTRSISADALTANLPWVQIDGQRVSFRRFIHGGGLTDTAQLAIWIAIGSAVVFTGDLRFARTLHDALLDALAELEMRTDSAGASFESFVHATTGCRIDQLRSTSPG